MVAMASYAHTTHGNVGEWPPGAQFHDGGAMSMNSGTSGIAHNGPAPFQHSFSFQPPSHNQQHPHYQQDMPQQSFGQVEQHGDANHQEQAQQQRPAYAIPHVESINQPQHPLATHDQSGNFARFQSAGQAFQPEGNEQRNGQRGLDTGQTFSHMQGGGFQYVSEGATGHFAPSQHHGHAPMPSSNFSVPGGDAGGSMLNHVDIHQAPQSAPAHQGSFSSMHSHHRQTVPHHTSHSFDNESLHLGSAATNAGAWRQFSSVLTQPLDVSSLMLPEFPTEGLSSSSSGSFSFNMGIDSNQSGAGKSDLSQSGELLREHAQIPLSGPPDLQHSQFRHFQANASDGTMASPIAGPSTQLHDAPRPGSAREAYTDSPALSAGGSFQYNLPPSQLSQQSWSDSPQTSASPSVGPTRIVSAPHGTQSSFHGSMLPQHHLLPRSNGGAHFYGHPDADYTDYRLSTALANNAHISGAAPPDGMVSRHLFQQSQPGVGTPIIKEEEESPYRFPPGAFPHSRQSLPNTMATSLRFQDYHDKGPEGASVTVARRAAPSVRPSVFQQYSNLDRRMFEERGTGQGEDCLAFIDEVMGNYLATPSRLGLGERSVVIMTSKVAQKSYGAEKRFLCPPPMVLLVGSSWWSACQEGVASSDEHKEPTVLTPPRLSISMGSEDSIVQDSVLEWASSNGKLLDTDNPSSEFAISGRSIGRQLFINDSDDKRKFCEALVHINVPTRSPSERRALGAFSSKPIKIISKPSKKRQSTRNTELGVLHGSTISLFHRLRSQTVSTRYLCVSGAPTWFKGSDGEPFLNTDSNTHIPNQGEPPSCFVAKTSSWDPFIIYLVDTNISAKEGADKQKSQFNQGTRPSQYPPPPFNALPLGTSSQAIHYNQPIVLQCLNTAVVSPVMVIRKVERGTSVIGGGRIVGVSGGESAEAFGDPVSQLHKIALEVVDDPSTDAPIVDAYREGQTPGQSGHFLGCLNENVGLRKPSAPRQWCNILSRPSTPTTPLTPMMMQNAGALPNDAIDIKSEPISPTAMASAYAAAQSRFNASQRLVMSPTGPTPGSSSTYGPNRGNGLQSSIVWDGDIGDESNAKRPRRVSSSVFVAQKERPLPHSSSAAARNRRRGQSLSVVGLQNQKQQQQQQQSNSQGAGQQRVVQSGSMAPPSSSGSSAYAASGSGPEQLRRASSFATSTGGSEASTANTAPPPSSMWSVDVNDSDIWTIVGVDIARHTFYLPPKLVGGAKGDAKSVDSTIAHLVNVPAPRKPITPIPTLSSFKTARSNNQGPAGRRRGASESSVVVSNPAAGPGSTAAALGSSATTAKGSDFATLIGNNLSTEYFVYFGDWRCTHVTASSPTTMLCAPPPSTDETGLPRGKVPITLVRRDGVIFPTSCIYPT